MSVKKRAHYLIFFKSVLLWLNLWPKPKKSCFNLVQQYFIPGIILITVVPIIEDVVVQFQEGSVSFTTISENVVALSALIGVTYITTCFINQRHNIKSLIQDLGMFESYAPRSLMQKTDQFVIFFTKLFIAYGIVGNICYGLLPILNYNNCQNDKSAHMVKYGIPCGLVVRFLLPFQFDYSPLAEVVAVYEIIICTLSSTITIIITMLICGVLIHTTALLKYLQERIACSNTLTRKGDVQDQMKFFVRFHIAIIDYATRADLCFNQIMLLHITWTGFVISILGFEITTTSNIIEAIRFAMHLAGWLIMLLIVCYYGQDILDNSSAIGNTIYSNKWYNFPVDIQKNVVLILLRSQKPLTLRAGGIKIMSLATFIGVLYSAYSYFTLLLKLKA